MARYTGPVCRLCRREGTKLFLKVPSAFPTVARSKSATFPLASTARTARQRSLDMVSNCTKSRRPSACTSRLRASSANTTRKPIAPQGVTGELLIQQTTRAPPGQRCLPSRLCHLAPPGPPVSSSRPCYGQRPQGEHSFLPGERGRRNRHPRHRQEAVDRGAGRAVCRAEPRAGMA